MRVALAVVLLLGASLPAARATADAHDDALVARLSHRSVQPRRAELEAAIPDVRARLLRLAVDRGTSPFARRRGLIVLAEWTGDDEVAQLYERLLRDEDTAGGLRFRLLRLLALVHPGRSVRTIGWAACQDDAVLKSGARRALTFLEGAARRRAEEAVARCPR
ncbi:MAG: hypothetical protein AAGH15_13910 [Myxococcota bacterium]